MRCIEQLPAPLSPIVVTQEANIGYMQDREAGIIVTFRLVSP